MDGLTVRKNKFPKAPGMSIDNFPKDQKELFVAEYNKLYPQRAEMEGPKELPADEELPNVSWIVVSGTEIRMEGSHQPNSPSWVEYVHRRYDDRSHLEEERAINDSFVYNQAQGYPNSVHDFLVSFDLEVLPGAYSGSVCGRSLSGKPTSTIGFEKRNNRAFRIENEDEFVRMMVADIPPAPPAAAQTRASNAGYQAVVA